MRDQTYIRFAGVADRDNEADMREARRATHDAVIEDLADRRTSGVTWLEYEPSAAEEILGQAGIGDEGNGLRKFLADNPNGLLVLATAECTVEVAS